MTTRDEKQLIPIAQAALQRRLNREQLLRRIQQGSVEGVFQYGRWYVVESAANEAPKSVA